MENNKEKVLSVSNLKVSFKTDEGLVHAVRGVSFDLYRGETLCIVGESGSGKSVTSKTIMGILSASAVIEDGEVIYGGEDLTKIDESEFHRIRGKKIGMIFQDPLSSLNPIKKVGKQITEALLVKKNRLKQYKDSYIAKEQALYKNAKVTYLSEVAKAENRIDKVISYYKTKINELDSKLGELKLAYLSADKKDGEKFKKALYEYNSFRATYASKVAELNSEKKKELIKAKKEKKERIKKAKSEYLAKKPELKKKLKLKIKEANKAVKRFKADVEKEYAEKISALVKENENKKNSYLKKINESKRNLPKAASQIVAHEELDKLTNEYNSFLKTSKEEVEKLKREKISKFKITKAEAKVEALKVMKEVGIPQPEIRFNQYPFQFSGGMRQRIVIAIALTANPEILICDEPTTALDVTIQAQILELINDLKRERNMSVIFITHDLGVVANMGDRVAVMYAGKIVEYGKVEEIFYDPKHPYTWALLSSIPDIDSKEKLEAIPGTPPYLLNPPKGDAFATRNKYALAIDFEEEPPYFKVSDTHYASTWLLDKRAPKVEMPKIVSQRIKVSLERAGVKHE